MSRTPWTLARRDAVRALYELAPRTKIREAAETLGLTYSQVGWDLQTLAAGGWDPNRRLRPPIGGRPNEPEPTTCLCDVPELPANPNALHECARCRRAVIR